jgi:hypothetical protein
VKAANPAIKEGSKTSYIIIPTIRTSTPNIAPEIGVPNTAANPALIPQITIFFLCSFENLNKSAIKDAAPAPICAAGPSLPAEPPAKIVITVAISFIGITKISIFPSLL